MTLPGAVLRSLAGIVGEPHVLTGDAAAGYAVDWTGRFQGQTPVVVRSRDTAEVAAVLALCTDAGTLNPNVLPRGPVTLRVRTTLVYWTEAPAASSTASRLA